MKNSAIASVLTVMVLSACGSEVTDTSNNVLNIPGIVVLVDVSDSNPILTSEPYAAKVAEDTKQIFNTSGLKEHSPILLTTFGTYSVEDNPYLIEAQISTEMRPQEVAEKVAQAIREIPKLVESGELEAQGTTNAVAALNEMSWRIDCSKNKFHVVLVSDGNEHSADYGIKIPPPTEPIYKGCGVLHVVGLTGNSPEHTKELAEQWGDYGEGAGFVNVKVKR